MNPKILFTIIATTFITKLWCVPVYYSFTGKINEITQTTTGASTAASFVLGQELTYLYLVDFDALGYVENNSNIQTIYNDNVLTDYYFSELIYGPIGTVSNPAYQGPMDIKAYKLGNHNYDGSFYFRGGSDYSYQYVRSSGSEFLLGNTYFSNHSIKEDLGSGINRTTLISYLTLTSINSEDPRFIPKPIPAPIESEPDLPAVPEPSTFALMSMFIVFGIFRVYRRI